jgi:hypothetical protein
VRHQRARRAVEQIDAQRLQLARQGDRVLDRPAAFGPVGGGDAHEQRQPLGPLGARGRHRLAQKPRAVLEAAAPAIGAQVRQRREELGEQVAVGGVQLEHLEAGLARTHRRGAEIGQHVDDARLVERLRHGRAGVEGHRARRHRAPAAGVGRDRLAAVPRPRRRGLAPGMRQLDAGRGAVAAHEARDALERLRLRVLPETEVVGRDAPLGRDRGGLGDHQPGAAGGERAQVHQVPIVGEAVLARVLAHGRGGDAVAQGERAKRQRIEERHLANVNRLAPRARLHVAGAACYTVEK